MHQAERRTPMKYMQIKQDPQFVRSPSDGNISKEEERTVAHAKCRNLEICE